MNPYKIKLPKSLQNPLQVLRNMKQENWGGVASLTGSTIVLLAADAASVAATIVFTAAEVTLARYGHKSWGYSAGMGGLALGDALLLFSAATVGNPLLQFSMAALAVTLGVAALRHPLRQATALLAKNKYKTSARILYKISRRIQPVTGTTALLLRFPTLYTALFSGENVNTVMASAVTLWGAADILCGRLKQRVIDPARRMLRRRDHQPSITH